MQENTTNQKNNSLIEKIETALPRTPETGKKIMLATGSIGFAICFGGLIYGGQAFVLGFIVMLCSVTGYRMIDKKN